MNRLLMAGAGALLAASTAASGLLVAGPASASAVHRARGYRSFVDSGWGSSVDVYFHNRTSNVKFEAEINDSGGLTVTVTTCRP